MNEERLADEFEIVESFEIWKKGWNVSGGVLSGISTGNLRSA